MIRRRPIPRSIERYEVHEHIFVSGPRSTAHYDRSGKWQGTHFSHSHAGASTPHSHPDTGPAFYGYRKPKTSEKPTGEQFELIALSEDEQTFDLVITDSAILSGDHTKPIGNTPIKQIHMPAAETMMFGSRLKCIVRDERRKP